MSTAADLTKKLRSLVKTDKDALALMRSLASRERSTATSQYRHLREAMLEHGAKGASYGAVRALAKSLEALGVAERIEGERVRWLYDLKSIGEVALGQEEKLRAFTTKGSSPRYIAASLTAQPPQPLTTAAPEAGEVLLSTKNGRLVLRHGKLDVIVDSQATLRAVLELLQG